MAWPVILLTIFSLYGKLVICNFACFEYTFASHVSKPRDSLPFMYFWPNLSNACWVPPPFSWTLLPWHGSSPRLHKSEHFEYVLYLPAAALQLTAKKFIHSCAARESFFDERIGRWNVSTSRSGKCSLASTTGERCQTVVNHTSQQAVPITRDTPTWKT